MNIETVWDSAVDQAVHNATLMPWQRVLDCDMPWLEWLKEATQMPRLFVYYSGASGRYSLAGWLKNPEESLVPVYMDLEGFDGPAACVGWPKGLLPPPILVDRLRPAEDSATRMRRLRKEAFNKRQNEKEDALAARTEMQAWLKKKGIDFDPTDHYTIIDEEKKKEWIDKLNPTQRVGGVIDGGKS